MYHQIRYNYFEASTKPHVHQKFEIFWTNIASAMACPNFKKAWKMAFSPLGVKINSWSSLVEIQI
jgi:hypothetical protein